MEGETSLQSEEPEEPRSLTFTLLLLIAIMVGCFII